MTAKAEFEAKMAALSTAFSQRTAGDAAEFEALGVALCKADDQAHRDRIQYLAHRLAGGSATFGLVTLEEPASHLETRILAQADATEIGEGSRALAETIRRICGEPVTQNGGNHAPA